MVYAFNVHENDVLCWENYVEYGFLTNEGFNWTKPSLPKNYLTVGTEIYAYIGQGNNSSKIGYVGHGIIDSIATCPDCFKMNYPNTKTVIDAFSAYLSNGGTLTGSEPLRFIKVKWLKTFDRNDGFVCQQGVHHFPTNHICEKFDQEISKHKTTLDELKIKFEVDNKDSEDEAGRVL